MGRLYGDSTPFPYDVDYLELVRGAVRCGVRLLLAQHAIDEALGRITAAEQLRSSERGKLDRVAEAVRQSMLRFEGGPDRETRVATRIREAARAAIDEEISSIEAQAAEETNRRRAEIEQAREASFRALEEFLRHHLVPGSETSVWLRAEEDGYSGECTLSTPFGVDATFRLDIPPGDEWGRVRRVSELSAGSEIQIPHEAGWISKRVELQRVKLDKLFVTELFGTARSGRLQLRKGVRPSPGYALEVGNNGSVSSAFVRELDERSNLDELPSHPIESEDRACVDRIFAAVTAAIEPLARRRASMITGAFEGRPLRDIDDPRTIANRLVQLLAPTVREIERRSGIREELVLRRDVDDGRREEKYVRKSELHDAVAVLPGPFRAVFDPLNLAPRNSLTPAPPVVAEREEISLELIDDESSPELLKR